MPYLFFGASEGSSSDGEFSGLWVDFGKFLTGVSAVGMVAIPVSLFHADYITIGALILELMAACTLYLSVLYYDYHNSGASY